MRNNIPDPQKQFLFLFTETDKNTRSELTNDGGTMQLEDLDLEEQLNLERAILSRLEKQGY